MMMMMTINIGNRLEHLSSNVPAESPVAVFEEKNSQITFPWHFFCISHKKSRKTQLHILGLRGHHAGGGQLLEKIFGGLAPHLGGNNG